MKRRGLFLIILFFLTCSPEGSGQVLQTRHGSVQVKKDSTIQLIIKNFRGSIRWQKTSDWMNWNDISGKTSGILIIKPDHEASYRAVVTEGTCTPVFSDTVAVVFTAPTASTNSVTAITQTTATCGGIVLSDGGSMVTSRGVCWSVSLNPTISQSKTTEGSGTGSFISTLTNLTPNTTYYLRAYASNEKGTAYGIQTSFTTSKSDENTVTDIDGNVYPTIKTGTQTWMKENLRVTHAPDNKAIISYLYNNDTQNEKTHGRLYSWDVAMNGTSTERAQGICPVGWHVPGDEEFKILEIFLGMTRAQADMENGWRGATVGTQLKVGGTSGFNAQLSGLRTSGNSYLYFGLYGYFWTSTAYGNDSAWRRCVRSGDDTVGRWNTFPKSYCFSIRCLKD